MFAGPLSVMTGFAVSIKMLLDVMFASVMVSPLPEESDYAKQGDIITVTLRIHWYYMNLQVHSGNTSFSVPYRTLQATVTILVTEATLHPITSLSIQQSRS